MDQLEKRILQTDQLKKSLQHRVDLKTVRISHNKRNREQKTENKNFNLSKIIFSVLCFFLLLCGTSAGDMRTIKLILLERKYERVVSKTERLKKDVFLFYLLLAHAQKEEKLLSRTEIYIFYFSRFVSVACSKLIQKAPLDHVR